MKVDIDRASKHSSFVSDVGYVYPIVAQDEAADIIIRPFLDCRETVQKSAARLLAIAFAHEQGIGGDDTKAERYILQKFVSSDIMFVMTDLKTKSQVLGLVTVDRRNFEPVIGHLAVAPPARGKGLSKLLLHVAEEFIAGSLGFGDAQLWCSRELVGFYERRGYAAERQLEDESGSPVVVMRKPLLAADAAESAQVAPAAGIDEADARFAPW